MDRKAEVEAKLVRLRALMEAEKAGSALFNTLGNYYWLTAGGEGRVGLDTRNAASSLLVTPTAVYVLTNNIEAPRLQQEALTGLGFEFVVTPWNHPPQAAERQQALTGSRPCLTDTPGPGLMMAGGKIRQLRYSLLPPEIERLEKVAADAAGAIEGVARRVQPGMSEMEIAGQMAAALGVSDLIPTVLLVGVDDRVRRYRHPLPTLARLQKYALLVCCCRRGGLTVSLSRAVHFGALPSELIARQLAAAQVDAAVIAATRVGTPVGEILQTAMRTYEQVGFPGEWQHHHQGGALGYENRDYLAQLDSTEVVQPDQPFAWNITIQGAKSEDTILSQAGSSPRLLSGTAHWPAIRVSTPGGDYPRPGILER